MLPARWRSGASCGSAPIAATGWRSWGSKPGDPPHEGEHLGQFCYAPVMDDGGPASQPVLTAEGLCKSYGALRAVDGVSFEVGSGEIVGLVGPNGAGKTTIINMTLGVL